MPLELMVAMSVESMVRSQAPSWAARSRTARPRAREPVRASESGASASSASPEFVTAERVAEVRAAHAGVIDDLLRRTFHEHPAVVDDQGSIAHPQRLRDVVIGDQHTLAELLAQSNHFLLQVFD